jgi:hypothetical protein
MRVIYDYDYEEDFFEFHLTSDEIDSLYHFKPINKLVDNKRIKRVMNITIQQETQDAAQKRKVASNDLKKHL